MMTRLRLQLRGHDARDDDDEGDRASLDRDGKSWHRSVLWVGASLLALAGCTEDMEVGAGHEGRMAVRDSMGVLISENFDSAGDASWSAGDAFDSAGDAIWTIRPEPVLTLGQDLRAPREYQFD